MIKPEIGKHIVKIITRHAEVFFKSFHVIKIELGRQIIIIKRSQKKLTIPNPKSFVTKLRAAMCDVRMYHNKTSFDASTSNVRVIIRLDTRQTK